MWRPTENLVLIDLGMDFFIVKFEEECNMNKVLLEGPWFITGHFLTVRSWEPNFVPNEAIIESTAIWVPINSPVKSSIPIGEHTQTIVYEGEGVLCKGCGRLGHTKEKCQNRITNQNAPSTSSTTPQVPDASEKWTTVIFSKKKTTPSPAKRSKTPKGKNEERSANHKGMYFHSQNPTPYSLQNKFCTSLPKVAGNGGTIEYPPQVAIANSFRSLEVDPQNDDAVEKCKSPNGVVQAQKGKGPAALTGSSMKLIRAKVIEEILSGFYNSSETTIGEIILPIIFQGVT
ncbi:uncharacterized protein LOC132057757 [Lycium ferocissimum]|uniref:uncharacterized protein LOC132057757 n=1 Tax=Lycium ferocissimum TaxID=112874 RepID=UPI0028167E87|nr:uncharacterized protein LOC132057757 [Lycium ferocissimum]